MIDILSVIAFCVVFVVLYYLDKKKEKEESKAETVEPVVLPVVTIPDGYVLIKANFGFGPPVKDSMLFLNGPFSNVEGFSEKGSFLYVPKSTQPFTHGADMWGAPVMSVGELYKKGE